jgi:hypothetical protein
MPSFKEIAKWNASKVFCLEQGIIRTQSAKRLPSFYSQALSGNFLTIFLPTSGVQLLHIRGFQITMQRKLNPLRALVN